jgi:tetratricopeptide (TPR) repeat protein
MTKANVGIVAGLAVLALFATGCEKLKARDHLNKGVQAFKTAKYTQAVDHFKEAVQLDPDFPTARLYLATAYMSQYIPGAESPENQQNAQAAEQEFLKVLEKDPKNTVAISSLASLHYNQAQGNQPMEKKMQQLEEAKKWYTKLAEVEPNNKEAYYSLGVITWAKWYPELMSARAKLGMKPEDPGPIKDNKVREELKAKWGPVVEEGIANLKKALEIDPEYDDAMAYVNLLTRERADLADSKDVYAKDIQEADNWVQKALETKKIKAERVANKGAVKAE